MQAEPVDMDRTRILLVGLYIPKIVPRPTSIVNCLYPTVATVASNAPFDCVIHPSSHPAIHSSIHFSLGSAPVGVQCPLSSSLGEFQAVRNGSGNLSFLLCWCPSDTPTPPISNTAGMSTLMAHCQWEDETARLIILVCGSVISFT